MQEFQTALELVQKIVGNKWKIIIICNLFNGRKRMSEFEYYIDGITQKVLTDNLKELEKDGICRKVLYDVQPPRTEYFLTDVGYSLKPIVSSLISWALDYSNSNKEQKTSMII